MKQLFLHINQTKPSLSGLFHVSIGKSTMLGQLKTLLLTMVCFCSVQLFYSQEDDGVVSFNLPVRNSLKFNRYVINPTFSFVREQNNYISAYNKREWVQFDDAPQTYLLGYSGRFAENIGAGIGLFQQNYGVLTTFGGILNFAYNARLERDSNLTFGLNLGVYKSGLNTGKVVTNFSDPSLDNIPSNLLLTVNPGINYGTQFLDFGVSINNVVLYNVQSSELIQDDPNQAIQAHVMYTGYMNGRGFFDQAKFSGLLRSEFGKETTTISGIVMLTSPKGIWGQVGFNSHYGASAGLGLNITQQIAVEYNFEKAMGDLTNFGPSHDITLAFTFNNKSNYKYGEDDEISSIFSSDGKRVLASNEPKMDAETRAQLKAESEAKRDVVRERAQVKAETRNQLAAVAKSKTIAETTAKQEEQERINALAQENAIIKAKEKQASMELAQTQARAQKAMEAQAKLEAQNKLKAEAKAKAEAQASLAKEAKAKADQEAKEKFPALERANAEARAKAVAEVKSADQAKAKTEQQAKENLVAQDKAKVEAEAKLAALAKVKADQDAKDKLVAQEKARVEAQTTLAKEAKTKAEQEAKEKLVAQEKTRVEAQATLAKEAKAKADQDAKDKLVAKEKAREDAEAKLAVAAKVKADQDAKDKIAAEEKARVDAEAKLALAAKTKADQDSKDKLAAQEKARVTAKAMADQDAKEKLVAQEKARIDAEEKLADALKAKQETNAQLAIEASSKIEAEKAAKLAMDEKARKQGEVEVAAVAVAKARQEAEVQAKKDAENTAQAKKEAEVKALGNPTDAIAVSMKSIADLAETSKKAQDELLTKFNELVVSKDKDLKDLKEENDLSEQGIYKAPKAFKSITEENNRLQAISTDLDNIIETNTKRIKELEGLYDDRLKIPTLENDVVNLYYQKTLKSLKAEQVKAMQTRTQLAASLKEINEATEFERKRRIKRAAYNNEEDRFMQDRASLNIIKQNTVLSAVPLKAEDFDFGEERGNNIQIIKNVSNIENGYYAVVAVHSDITKRDEFITKAVSGGQSNIDFFYDVNNSKYFIYTKKFDGIEAAAEAMKNKGNQAYNSKMSIIKIEN